MLAAELEVDFTAVATIGLGGHIFDRAVVANPDGGASSPTQIVEVLSRAGRIRCWPRYRQGIGWSA